MPDLTLYGIALTAIILGLVKLFQDRAGLSNEGADWLRAILATAAFLLVQNAELLQSLYPWFETAVVQIGGAVGMFLTVMGYWPEVRRTGYRMQGLTAQGLEQ